MIWHWKIPETLARKFKEQFKQLSVHFYFVPFFSKTGVSILSFKCDICDHVFSRPWCLSYLKRYFQRHQWNVFFFRDQITQILFFWGECQFGINQRSQFDRKYVTKIYFAVEICGRCLLNVKKCFQNLLLGLKTLIFFCCYYEISKVT